MKVQEILYLFLVIFNIHLSFGMPQILRSSPRDNMVGGFRPSPPSSPFLKRNENRGEPQLWKFRIWQTNLKNYLICKKEIGGHSLINRQRDAKRCFVQVIARCAQLYFLPTLAESFYNIINRMSFITSKSSSKNLSNEIKHWSFGCLQDKTSIKMPIFWKYRVHLFSLLRFQDQFFDVINDDTLLTL